MGQREPDPEPRSGNAYEIYTSEEVVTHYTGLAVEGGLFPPEQQVVEQYFRRPGAKVLDVGCGAGRVTKSLHDLGFEVTGIDISEPLIEAAREQYPAIDFRVSDITDSGFPAAVFDYAIFSWVGLDYVLPKERRLRALRELHRVLKPGGVLAFSSHNSWNHLPSMVMGNWDYVKDLYLTRKNLPRLFHRSKIESIEEGDIEIYISNPLHQWRQLRDCGFTLLDVLGQYDGVLRFFVRQPYYVAKK